MATAPNEPEVPPSLTPAQTRALFDILTHHETYAEITSFKQPSALAHYGAPFQPDLKSSNSPVLQSLVANFALTLPGLRSVSPEFWTVRVRDLIDDLAKAELSESYDKGVLGVRKTLATAISALIEYPARGLLAGVGKEERRKKDYDVSKPEDVMRSWHDALQELVYGDLVEELFEKAAETGDLEAHGGLVRGMHEFVVVNIASLMHYTLILSPEGPTLLRMISSVHGLLPYMAIRQALKIGNVATMIGAVMRLILAKASVGTVTNWLGMTSGADEGQNLLQQIISQVLGWDKRELKKSVEKLDKDKQGPPKEVLSELRSWISQRSREEHEECRRQSRESGMSIVAVILATSSASTSLDDMTEAQHAKALEYLALQLGIRDRQEIVRVLCRSNPDHVTAAVRDAVDAYTPMIRHVHQAVNLADTVWDFERFTTDMLKMSKPKSEKGKDGGVPPSVEDYVDLLHRHQSSSHKFLHQVAKNGKEVTGWWREWVHMACNHFKRDDNASTQTAPNTDKPPPAGGDSFTASLTTTFISLPSSEQKAVRKELDAWSQYLSALHAASASRIAAIIKRKGSTPYGPGAYLARWQHLLDRTVITPESKEGRVRSGASASVRGESRAGAVGGDGEEGAGGGEGEGGVGREESGEKVEVEAVESEAVEKALEKGQMADAPGVENVVRLFGARFREIIAAASDGGGG